MAAEVGPACSHITEYSLSEKPFFVEKAWRSQTATHQLNPPRKRRVESISGRTNGDVDDRKKRQKGATHTEAKDSVDKPCEGTEQTASNGTAGQCWLRTMKYKSLRPGWKGEEPSEDTIGSSGEEDSDDEDNRRQPGAQKVAAGLHEQPVPWERNFIRREATPSDQRAVDFPYNLVQRYEIAQSKAFVKPAGSQLGNVPASRILTGSKDGNRLPEWVHPKWTKVFLPTLVHALFISKRPFQEFKPSSPIFVATVQQLFGLVYSSAMCNVKEGNILVEEAAQRLASKRSKIAAAVMREVKNFFERDTYVNHPDQIEGYVRWALQPDGPAYHEAPTPITCKFERSHQEYIHPKGTFQSPFINRVAKHFLLQAKSSVLDPPISASNPPKGLYGLLLISVERAFIAFDSGDYKKPKGQFSYENYWGQLETYMGHLDAVRPELWKEILYRANTSDVDTPQDNAPIVSIHRRNLYIPGNEG